MRGKHPKLVAGVGVATIALALGAPGTATAHGRPHAVPIKKATFNAYATGTYLHTHLLEDKTSATDPVRSRLVNVNVAGSAAAVDSKGLVQRADEMGRFVVDPEAPGKITWGRGVAIEAGLDEDVPSGEPDITIAGVAEQSAPPTVDTPEVEEILEIDEDPLIYNSTARGEASANWDTEDPCIYKAPGPPRNPFGPPPDTLAADLGFGMGSVEDLELLDLDDSDDGLPTLEEPLLALNVTTGQGIKKRSTGWTSSQTYLSGQYSKDGNVLGPDHGLTSEVRATLLPITLFTGGLDENGEGEGTDEITIEFLGPWRLLASAGGVPGSAWVHFGPEEEDQHQPILRISTRDEQGEDNEDILTVQDLFDDDEDDGEPGEHIEIGGNGLIDENGGNGEDDEKIADIFIGEAPRAIGDESEDSQPTVAADGTVVSAAADVVRIELVETEEVEVAEIRLGHFEVEAEVPAGGLSCKPPKLPPTGDDEPLPRAGEDNGGTAVGADNALLASGSDKSVPATSQVTDRVRPAGAQLPPITRAVGLFSAVVAILISGGALLRRRWSRS